MPTAGRLRHRHAQRHLVLDEADDEEVELDAGDFLRIDADDPADAVRRIDDVFAGLEIGLAAGFLTGIGGFRRLGGHNRAPRASAIPRPASRPQPARPSRAGHDRLAAAAGLAGAAAGFLAAARSWPATASRQRPCRAAWPLPRRASSPAPCAWRPASGPRLRALDGTAVFRPSAAGFLALGLVITNLYVPSYTAPGARTWLSAHSDNSPTGPEEPVLHELRLGAVCAWKGGGFAQKRLITPTTWRI